MNIDADSKSVLRINQMLSEYLVSSDHPAPEKLRAKLDETTNKHLPAMLARMLTTSFGTDQSLWFIRRMELEVDVNVVWDPDRVALSTGSQLARHLALDLQGTGDGENVLWFPDRAAYLAKFLCDLVAGSAWNKWYYKSFAGLKALPIGAALRTAMCDHPAVAFSALRSLDAQTRTRALELMSEADARRVLTTFADTNASSPGDALTTALDAVEEAGAAPFAARFEARRTLFWYIAAGERMLGPEVRDALMAVARWMLLCDQRANQDLRALVASLDASAVDRLALRPLLLASPSVLNRLMLLMAEVSPQRGNTVTEIRHTNFGGAFLLAPLLARMPIDAATRHWPGAAHNEAAALIRFFLLVKCNGRNSARRAVQDELLREIAGIQSGLSHEEITAWRSRVTPAHRAAFLRELCEDANLTDAECVDTTPQEGDSRSSATDLEFLRLPRDLGLGIALDRTLTIAARQLLRNFASRLPGFAASNPLYLHANFLNIDANLEYEAERHVVRLSRPPLHLMLTMTGMFNQTYTLPWLNARPFVHFPQD